MLEGVYSGLIGAPLEDPVTGTITLEGLKSRKSQILLVLPLPPPRFRSPTHGKQSRMRSIISISQRDGTITVMYLSNITLAGSSRVAV